MLCKSSGTNGLCQEISWRSRSLTWTPCPRETIQIRIAGCHLFSLTNGLLCGRLSRNRMIWKTSRGLTDMAITGTKGSRSRVPASSEGESQRDNNHLKNGGKIKFSGTIGLVWDMCACQHYKLGCRKERIEFASDSVHSPSDPASQVRLAYTVVAS